MINKLRRWRGLWLWMALGVLAGCGFQLQGQQSLPATLSTVSIEARDDRSAFYRALRANLQTAGATLHTAAQPDIANIRVVSDELKERVLAVSSRNIPTDYELTYEVEIAVTRAGRALLDAELFSLSGVYSFDERRLLAKDREAENLKNALARDLASVVVRRLGSL